MQNSVMSFFKHAITCHDINLPFVECGVSCHRKCEQYMANLCGVNKKMMSQLITEVTEKKEVTNEKRVRFREPKASSSEVSRNIITLMLRISLIVWC